jgi:hypothetical protein
MELLNPAVAAFAGFMIWRNGSRALLFMSPGLLKITGSGGPGPQSTRMLRVGEELERLGFARLGEKRERGPFGAPDIQSEVWVNEAAGAYADLFPFKGADPFLYYFSMFPDGAVVMTADHKWHDLTKDMVQAGGLQGASPEGVWAAHKIAVERFAGKHGKPAAPASIETRLEASRRWYEGFGRRGLRRMFLVHFLNLVVALLLLVAAVGLMLKR